MVKPPIMRGLRPSFSMVKHCKRRKKKSSGRRVLDAQMNTNVMSVQN